MIKNVKTPINRFKTSINHCIESEITGVVVGSTAQAKSLNTKK